MAAIAIRKPVVRTPTRELGMRVDGGMAIKTDANGHPDERPGDCDCGE